MTENIIKKTTYPIDRFKQLISEKCFPGKNVTIHFNIDEFQRDWYKNIISKTELVSVDIVEEVIE